VNTVPKLSFCKPALAPAAPRGAAGQGILFRTSTVPDIKEDYHETEVAQASSLHVRQLQTRGLRYIFIQLWMPRGMAIHGMTT